MRLPASQRIPTAIDRRVSNFDQFFVGLPINLYERPHRNVGRPPRLAEDVVRLVPVFPPGTAQGVSSVPTLSHFGLGRFRLPLGCSHRKQPPMTSLNLRADIYDPKTLAAMDQAFAAVWRMVRSDDPFRDYANDTELKIAIGKKLLNLVVDGVTDPLRLRNLTVESLLLPRH